MQNSKQQARQGGFAMIMVLCIGALFVALATALLYAASLLTANANRQLTEQEVYGMASTFSARLDTDLTGYDKVNPALKNELGDEVLRYLYSGEDAVTFDCSSDLSTLDGADSLSVTLRNKRAEEITPQDDTTPVDLPTDYADAVQALETTNKEEPTAVYTFEVSVTATLKDQSFTYTQSYQCNVLPYYTFDDASPYTYDDRKERAFFGATGNKITMADAQASTTMKKHRVVSDAEPTAVRFSNRAKDSGVEVSP